jgi:hypothetical protein
MSNRQQYLKEYRQKNKDKQKEYKAKYSAENKEKIKMDSSIYYYENKDIICEKKKIYYAKNSIEILKKRETKREQEIQAFINPKQTPYIRSLLLDPPIGTVILEDTDAISMLENS